MNNAAQTLFYHAASEALQLLIIFGFWKVGTWLVWDILFKRLNYVWCAYLSTAYVLGLLVWAIYIIFHAFPK